MLPYIFIQHTSTMQRFCMFWKNLLIRFNVCSNKSFQIKIRIRNFLWFKINIYQTSYQFGAFSTLIQSLTRLNFLYLEKRLIILSELIIFQKFHGNALASSKLINNKEIKPVQYITKIISSMHYCKKAKQYTGLFKVSTNKGHKQGKVLETLQDMREQQLDCLVGCCTYALVVSSSIGLSGSYRQQQHLLSAAIRERCTQVSLDSTGASAAVR